MVSRRGLVHSTRSHGLGGWILAIVSSKNTRLALRMAPFMRFVAPSTRPVVQAISLVSLSTSRCQSMSKSCPARTTRVCHCFLPPTIAFRCMRSVRTSLTIELHYELHHDLEGVAANSFQMSLSVSRSQFSMLSTCSREVHSSGSALNGFRHCRTCATPSSDPGFASGVSTGSPCRGTSYRSTAWSLRSRLRSSI